VASTPSTRHQHDGVAVWSLTAQTHWLMCTQVFDAVNNLLERKRRPHGLRVRTYAIVPLAPQAGVIEWVEHTLPFGMYLVPRNEPKGAHERYFPEDLKHTQCRQRLDAIKHTSQSASSTQRKPVNTTQARKRKAFDEVCSRFRPAFRFFFLETCADAKTWLRHRDAYTRSVAANAMVGHVLGIGDRHVQNILLIVKRENRSTLISASPSTRARH